jgi:succinate dehydrogenase hydrophobic anchor subunit
MSEPSKSSMMNIIDILSKYISDTKSQIQIFTIDDTNPDKLKIQISFYISIISILIIILAIYIYTISTNKANSIYNNKPNRDNTPLVLTGKYKSRKDKFVGELTTAIIMGVALLISMYAMRYQIWLDSNNKIKIAIMVALLIFTDVSHLWIFISIIISGILSTYKYNTTNIINILLTMLCFVYSIISLNQSIPFLDLPHSIV